jgi:hypothetical protein
LPARNALSRQFIIASGVLRSRHDAKPGVSSSCPKVSARGAQRTLRTQARGVGAEPPRRACAVQDRLHSSAGGPHGRTDRDRWRPHRGADAGRMSTGDLWLRAELGANSQSSSCTQPPPHRVHCIFAPLSQLVCTKKVSFASRRQRQKGQRLCDLRTTW